MGTLEPSTVVTVKAGDVVGYSISIEYLDPDPGLKRLPRHGGSKEMGDTVGNSSKHREGGYCPHPYQKLTLFNSPAPLFTVEIGKPIVSVHTSHSLHTMFGC